MADGGEADSVADGGVADGGGAGEAMTAPDNGMEEALRRALTEAVSQVEPGRDALDRIRTRIGHRPPQPWLVSVIADILGRLRHWTWRGHWAWQLSSAWPATVAAPSALPWPRLRRLPRPGAPRPAAARPAAARVAVPARHPRFVRLDTVNWLRPVAVLAGIAIIASVSFGVQPFRQAIIQASNTVLTGGQQPTGGAGTEGSGTPTGDVTHSSGAPATSHGSTYSGAPGRGVTTSGGAASASAVPSAECPPSLMVDVHSLLVYKTTTGTEGTVTSPAPETPSDFRPTATASATPSPSCTAASSPAASATPSPSVSPTPSVSATSPSPTPTPTTSSPTPTSTPTDTGSPTPTDSGSPTPTDSGSDSPTATPTDSGGDTGDGGEGGTPAGATPSATPSATSS